MATTDWQRVREVFETLVELDTEQRDARLDAECEGNDELRSRVSSLLASHECEDDFLSPPPVEDPSRDGVPSRAEPGTLVGSFELVRVLASGGMGTVYEAVQSHPHRTVAVKMMATGLDSSRSRRRFQYESEILARLRHPAIAQVYEAGIHVEGQGPRRREIPWFAMELVEGARELLSYAVAEDLDTRARLELFTKICAAVHHGHLKGIVHRDLKPGNILVDSSGQPKIIDFGVARATDSDLAATTALTRRSELAGTLRYMSPEQVEPDVEDIDARSDIYSLGVVLYELVCRSPPYPIEDKAVHEVARIIREVEPKRPGLVRPELTGDLEWIVLRALSKDRDRRYPSADRLREDIHHFLADETIEARPPSMLYKARMFARRNRVAVYMTAALVVALSAGLVGTLIYAARESQERGRAEEARNAAREAMALAQAEAVRAREINVFVQRMLTASRPDQQGHGLRVREVVDAASLELERSFADQPLLAADLHDVLGQTYLVCGDYTGAERQFRMAVSLRRAEQGDDRPETLESAGHLGRVLHFAGRHAEAELVLEETLARVRSGGEPTAELVPWAANLLAALRLEQGRPDDARELWAEALELYGGAGGATEAEGASVRNNLGRLHLDAGRSAPALELFTNALATQERLLGAEHPEALRTGSNLARALLARGEGERAETQARDTALRVRERLGPRHPASLTTRAVLAEVLAARGSVDEAEEILRRNLAVRLEDSGREDAGTLLSMSQLGSLLRDRAKFDEAQELLDELAERRREVFGESHPRTLDARFQQALLLGRRGRTQECVDLLVEVHAARALALGPEHIVTLRTRNALGWNLGQLGEYGRAEDELRGALERSVEVLGELDADTQSIRNNLAGVLYESGDTRGAVDVLRTALDALHRTHGEEAPLSLNSASNLGLLLNEIGEYEEAEELLSRTLESQTRIFGRVHDKVLATTAHLGKAMLGQGDLDGAEGHRADALAITRELFGDDHPTTILAIENFGFFLFQRERFFEAEDLLTEAVERAGSAMGDHWYVGYCKANLGTCLLELGEHEDAERLLLEGYTELDGLLGPDDHRTIDALRALVRLYDAMGLQEERDLYAPLLGGG